MNAPIVLLVYKRPEHTQKVLDALSKNKGVEESELFVFGDGAKKDEDRERVNEVRKVVSEFSRKSVFKTFNYYFSDKNMGLASSVIKRVSQVIEQYGKVIVLEDDLIPTEDFLEYMNNALLYYERNNSIWGISGYTFHMNQLNLYPHDVYLSYRGCSWGWATWRNRWNQVDWEVKDYKKFVFNPIKRLKFSRGGNDLPGMLDSEMRGFISSWAIRWCYQAMKNDALIVYPKKSRIINTGTDGSGTHGAVTDKFDSPISDGSDIKFEDVVLDKKIIKEFKRKYSYSPEVRIKNYIKHVILNRK